MIYFRKETYQFFVDYYSSDVEIAKLDQTCASGVILHLKSIFARHGIPTKVVPDNGPQYAAHEVALVVDSVGFIRAASSPCFPQSSDESESSVQTVKNYLQS